MSRVYFRIPSAEIICYRGQNYVPQKATARVRLHNWLVSKESVPS